MKRIVIGFVVLGSVIACSATGLRAPDATGSASDSSSDPATPIADAAPAYDGSRSPCSTGPAYTFDTVFSVDDHAYDPAVPNCIPRCDYRPAGPGNPGELDITALPSGHCAYDGEACQMAAWRTCSCPERGDYSGYECSCVGGAWACVITSQGGAVCECPRDGGR